MNGLSWILYLADVSGSTRFAAVSVMVIGVLACVITILAFFASGEANDKDAAALQSSTRKTLKFFVPFVVIAFLFHAFLPSQRTLMLIAASEVGEDVLSTETAQNIGGEAGQLATDSLRLLHKYVNEQLGDKPAAETK